MLREKKIAVDQVRGASESLLAHLHVESGISSDRRGESVMQYLQGGRIRLVPVLGEQCYCEQESSSSKRT